MGCKGWAQNCLKMNKMEVTIMIHDVDLFLWLLWLLKDNLVKIPLWLKSMH